MTSSYGWLTDNKVETELLRYLELEWYDKVNKRLWRQEDGQDWISSEAGLYLLPISGVDGYLFKWN